MGRSGNKHPNSIPVYQYDMNGNYIQSFESLNLAQNMTGISHQLIIGCCKKKYNYGGGFIWRYDKHDNIEVDRSKFHIKPIKMYDMDGIFIKEYQSTKLAAIDNNLDPSCITKCCKKKIKQYKGNRFCYSYETL